MEEPWTLVVVAVCSCFVLCALLFTILRCCVCSFKGMKEYRQEVSGNTMPFGYRPTEVFTISEAASINASRATIATMLSSKHCEKDAVKSNRQ